MASINRRNSSQVWGPRKSLSRLYWDKPCDTDQLMSQVNGESIWYWQETTSRSSQVAAPQITEHVAQVSTTEASSRNLHSLECRGYGCQQFRMKNIPRKLVFFSLSILTRLRLRANRTAMIVSSCSPIKNMFVCFIALSSHFHCLCLITEPEMAAVARLSRAEAYTALKQYKLALEDSEFCCATEPSAEVGCPRHYEPKLDNLRQK